MWALQSVKLAKALVNLYRIMCHAITNCFLLCWLHFFACHLKNLLLGDYLFWWWCFFCFSPLPCWRMVGTGQVWPWCKCLSFARQGSADPGFVQLSGQHSLHTGGRRLKGISVPWLIVPSCYSQAVPLAIGHAVKRPSKNRPTRNPNAQWVISAGSHTSVTPYTEIFSCLGCIGDRVWREDAGSVQG